MSTSKPFLLTGRVSANVNPAHGGYRPEETRKFLLLFRAWAARSGAGFDENVVAGHLFEARKWAGSGANGFRLACQMEALGWSPDTDLVVLLEHMSSSGWLDRLHDVIAGPRPG